MAKKILIVKIHKRLEHTEKITVVLVGIDCSSHDEASIKVALESSRNPAFLTQLIVREISKEGIGKNRASIDTMRSAYAAADEVEVGFLSMDGCDHNCESCIIGDIAHIQEIAFATDPIHRICPN